MKKIINDDNNNMDIFMHDTNMEKTLINIFQEYVRNLNEFITFVQANPKNIIINEYLENYNEYFKNDNEFITEYLGHVRILHNEGNINGGYESKIHRINDPNKTDGSKE
jgi:hypothetical protein